MDIKFSRPVRSGLSGCNSYNLLAALRGFPSTQLIQILSSELQQTDIQEFQLGSELLSFTPFNSSERPLGDRLNDSDCYLVCEGRVRLLCQSLPTQRQVPASTLEVGEAFGVDDLFCATPLPYRAIAASSCRVAKISYQRLRILLEKLPQLQEHLRQMAQQRESLIFFKRFTQLYSRPSSILKQVLLPRLIKQEVQAGQYLAEAMSANVGYFWLRTGQIYSPVNPAMTPVIGDSWGYPNPIPNDWIAQTNLMVYKLMLEPWQINGFLSLL